MSEPTLDDMAREVVEWMDGWEYNGGNKFGISGNGIYWLSKLYTSLDVIRKVEGVVMKKGLGSGGKNTYIRNLWRLVRKEYSSDVSFSEDKELYLSTADPKTRLRAIYNTLKKAGKLNGT